MTIDPKIKAQCETAVDYFMREVKGCKSVIICTEDGFEVAARLENSAHISRLSAMASSFSALGALVGEESQLGACNHVMIDAHGGLILILQTRNSKQPLTFCVVTSKDAIAGQVLYFAKQAALTLASK
jgi:uncharacterized protein